MELSPLCTKKLKLWYSLEEPRQGTPIEYHNMFSWRNKENISIFLLKKKKAPYLEVCDLGPVVQSIVSLISSLVVKILF